MPRLFAWSIALGACLSCSASSPTAEAPGSGEWQTGTRSAPRITAADAGPVAGRDTAAPGSAAPIDAAPQPQPPARTPGWYCVELREHWEQKSYVSICTKTSVACENHRIRTFDRGIHSSECVYRATAYCFHHANPVERFDAWHCTDTKEQCLETRESFTQPADPDSTYTDCRLQE